MNKKQKIKTINESHVRTIVAESLRKILKENSDEASVRFVNNMKELSQITSKIREDYLPIYKTGNKYEMNNYFQKTKPQRAQTANTIINLLNDCENIYNQLQSTMGNNMPVYIYNFCQTSLERCKQNAEEYMQTDNKDLVMNHEYHEWFMMYYNDLKKSNLMN